MINPLLKLKTYITSKIIFYHKKRTAVDLLKTWGIDESRIVIELEDDGMPTASVYPRKE